MPATSHELREISALLATAPDYPGHSGSLRLGSDSPLRRIAGSSQGLQPSVFERDNAVETAGEIEIVGGDQRGEAGVTGELEECVQYALAGRVIEVAGRLVAEQDPGVVGERPGDRDALLLAAGEPRRPMPGTRHQTDAFEERCGFFPCRPARHGGRR